MAVSLSKHATTELKKILQQEGADPQKKLDQLRSCFSDAIQKIRGMESKLSTSHNRYETISSTNSALERKVEKLENLCRTLQQQKKLLGIAKETSEREERAKQEALSKKFETSIADIQTQINNQADQRREQIEENSELRKQLQSLIQKYDKREEYFKQQLHAEDLKRQLLVAEQAQENHAIQEDLKKLSLYKEQSALLQQSESRATQQLSFYKEKFDSFDEAITESNKTFTTLRTNLDSSGKIIKRLEAENRLVKEKETATSKQNSKLSDLCKALQKQRSKLAKETAVLKAKVVQLEKQIEN
jgi:chromosome segregation ATPase